MSLERNHNYEVCRRNIRLLIVCRYEVLRLGSNGIKLNIKRNSQVILAVFLWTILHI